MSTQQKYNKYQFTSCISYSKDNIFDIAQARIMDTISGSSIIIPHVCNNVNAYGAGFASDISQIFPCAKVNFHLLGNQAKLGHVQFVDVKNDSKSSHKIIVANMIAQNGLVNDKNQRPLNYAALVTCMLSVKNYFKNFLKLDISNRMEIHSPKFGSGLAGGDWKFISELIHDIWYDCPVFVYSKKIN